MWSRSRIWIAIVAIAMAAPLLVEGSASAQSCETAQLECLPTPEECASGQANGVWLGKHIGSAAACAGSGGTTLAYAGGNAALLCGSIVVAGQAVVADDPRSCDALLEHPDELTFRVQLPSDYATSDLRYPVLYLLPGGGGDENIWFEFADLSAYADQGVIIVSPYNGISFYTDWLGGQYMFESLYIDTLIPLIDATYRTIPTRAFRAVAGFSQGGFGALLWTARHPDVFSVAGSFSGISDLTLNDPFGDFLFSAQMTTLATYDDPLAPNPAFGDPITDAIWWHDSNPTDLVRSLRDASLWISVGDGLPGEHDSDPLGIVFGGPAESVLLLRNISLKQELDEAGLTYQYRTHRGTHSYLYAADDLRDWFPFMMSALGRPDPTSFDYRTAESSFEVWDWSFDADPGRAAEFLDVTQASSAGVTLTGSGVTTVRTPALFSPGAIVTLSGAETPSATAAEDGSITFEVDLGPAHTDQQYSPVAIVAELAGDYFTTKTVRFSI